MEAIEVMMAEHRIIERGIDGLMAFADGVLRGSGDQAELGRFVRFIREFADTNHHGKEEGILFAAMVEAGFPRQAGPIGVMLHEHDEGRRQVAVLAALAEQATPWSPDDRQRLLLAARAYGELLRAHIRKEDSILYPMAEQRLPVALAGRVDQACAAFDAGQAAGTRRALEQLGAELAARHAPARASA